MGIETMRGSSGRCPPFLLGGCILFCIILVCNWWSLSSQNNDLLKQIDEMEDQMKNCCRERDQCVIERNRLENNLGHAKVELDKQKMDTEKIIKKQEKDLTVCKTELESLKILDISKTESLDTLRANLDDRKEEIQKLNEQIKFLNSQIVKEKNMIHKHKLPAKDSNKDDDNGIATNGVHGEQHRDILTEEEDIDHTDPADGERDRQMAGNTDEKPKY